MCHICNRTLVLFKRAIVISMQSVTLLGMSRCAYCCCLLLSFSSIYSFLVKSLLLPDFMQDCHHWWNATTHRSSRIINIYFLTHCNTRPASSLFCILLVLLYFSSHYHHNNINIPREVMDHHHPSPQIISYHSSPSFHYSYNHFSSNLI